MGGAEKCRNLLHPLLGTKKHTSISIRYGKRTSMSIRYGKTYDDLYQVHKNVKTRARAVQDSQMLCNGIDTSQRILTGGGWLEFKRPVRVAQILVLYNYKNYNSSYCKNYNLLQELITK